jgi:hypothetical protein
VGPREKYPRALGMFRYALATIDPNNALATQSIALIEDIYRNIKPARSAADVGPALTRPRRQQRVLERTT